jgi:hypothetical protein
MASFALENNKKISLNTNFSQKPNVYKAFKKRIKNQSVHLKLKKMLSSMIQAKKSMMRTFLFKNIMGTSYRFITMITHS